jgi:hypothetical protein
MINLIPLPYKLAAAGVAVIAAGAYGFSLGWAWNADDLTECESTVESVREISHALEVKNEAIRLEAERVTADVSQRWSAALDHARANPRIVRVQDHSCPGGVPAFPGSTAGLNAANGIAALSATEITAAECETQLNMGYRDASKHEFLMDWIKQQQGVGQ